MQGTSTGDNEIDLQLINNTIDGSPLSVTKAGAGTWILGNTNNTYSGATTITAGALRAQDAGENATSGVTTAPTVASNILTLATIQPACATTPSVTSGPLHRPDRDRRRHRPRDHDHEHPQRDPDPTQQHAHRGQRRIA